MKQKIKIITIPTNIKKCTFCKKYPVVTHCWKCDNIMFYTCLSNKLSRLWNKIDKFKDDVPKKRILEIMLNDVLNIPPLIEDSQKVKRIRKEWEKELGKLQNDKMYCKDRQRRTTRTA